MLILLWFALYLAAACLLLLPLALWLREIYQQYAGSRVVACPDDQRSAAVTIDARHAVATGIDGVPELRLCECTRWPEHADCGQGCLAQALQAGSYAPAEGKAKTKQIYHLPVLLAAFVAWCLGAVWHAQYMFRPQWMESVGLTHAEVKQMVWWLSPHLLTAAVCVLFAYGVAALLALFHRKGVLQGLLMAALLCAALAVASSYALARMPHDLLLMEAEYAVLAVLTVGAIVGGLQRKDFLLPEAGNQ